MQKNGCPVKDALLCRPIAFCQLLFLYWATHFFKYGSIFDTLFIADEIKSIVVLIYFHKLLIKKNAMEILPYALDFHGVFL